MLCLGDSILISGIGGIFPSRWEADVSLFLSRHSDPVSVSSRRPVEPGPPPTPRDEGEEHEHHGKGGCPWARSHDGGALFGGRRCIRCSPVSTWSPSKCSRLSHGKKKRDDLIKNKKRHVLVIPPDKCFASCPGGTLAYYSVYRVHVRCDPWLLAGRIHRDQTGGTGPLLLRLFPSYPPSQCFHHKSSDSEAPPHAPAAPPGPGFRFPRAQPLGSAWISSDVRTLASSVNRHGRTVGQSPGVWLRPVNRSARGGPGCSHWRWDRPRQSWVQGEQKRWDIRLYTGACWMSKLPCHCAR